tara:strand:+ start:1180 stop:1584 length:405 start_codon:yes stop_codon:yes gene_type:complete
MALPNTEAEIRQFINSPQNKAVTELLQNQDLIGLQQLPQIPQREHTTGLQINVEHLSTLPISQQDNIIRSQLTEWQLGQFQKQILTMISEENNPLIFKVGFWLCSIVIWAGSIIGGKILNQFAEYFIIPRLFRQ